uniref:F-box domain-containing protein n=1 Tax=Steinernema glaseri TaxID=37863 RepID=A0A1I7Z4L1_9BILA
MALLGPADKQLSDVAEHLRLLSDCLYVVLFRIPDKLIFPHFDKALNSCMVTLRIPETSIEFYGSGQNAKYFIDPEGVTEELKCHIVTLGIDENAKIEKEWMLKFKHCTFFGIDRSSGDIISLMRAGNVTAPIDQISLKIKALEYSIWDMFFKGGTLDEVSYSVCQWNIGYHQPDDAEKAQFGNFMKKLMKDKRYVPMKFDISEVTNVYYLNIEDPFCILRYVAGRF